MIEIFAYVVAVIAVLWVYLYVKYKDFNDKLDKIPGPKGLPVIHNLFDLGKNPVDILKTFSELCKQYPKIFKTRIGPVTAAVMLLDAKHLEIVLTSQKHITKSDGYDFLRPWIGDGLLTATGSKWKKQRRLLTPAFHFKILEEFVDRFNSNSDVLVEKLSKEIGKQYFDVYPYVTMAALDIICETAMGISINAQSFPETEYIQAVRKMCNIIIMRTFTMLYRTDFPYCLTQDYKTQQECLGVLHKMTNSVIKKRRAEFNKKQQPNYEEDDVGKKRKVAFLDLLLESTMDGEPLPDEYIREEVDTFMFEGHDTVSSAIAFALYELSRRPEIQEKVVDELRTIFADDPMRQVTYRDLQDMKYMEMVVKETLRLNPSVPSYVRRLQEDLDLGDYVIPNGCQISIFCYGIHRKPEYYPDPEKFDPERFNPENSAKRNPYVYIPFSAGPRNCIGQKFAFLEIKSVLSKVLRHYVLHPGGPELKMSFEVVLKSTTGVPVRIEKRKNF